MREKTITLYSRNGIRITKTINVDTSRKQNYKNSASIYMFDTCEIIKHGENKGNSCNSNVSGRRFEKKRVKSKLGFYYEKYVSLEIPKHNESKEISAVYTHVVLDVENTKYELKYPKKLKSSEETIQGICIDMRPWDILPGYKGMPDSMINALLKEVNNFLDIADSYKCKYHGSSVRKYVMVDLFGYEDGPKIQPNDIKILSHGFDLKTSFRKRKDS